MIATLTKSALGRAVALLASLAMNWLLAKEIPVAGFGVFTLCITVLTACSQVSRAAMPSYIMKETSHLWEHEIEAAAGKLNGAIFVSFCASLIVVLGMTVTYFSFNHLNSFERYKTPILFSMAVLTVFSINWLLSASLKSLGRAHAANFLETGLVPLFMCAALFLFNINKETDSLIAYACCVILAFFVMSVLVRRGGWSFSRLNFGGLKFSFIYRVTLLNVLGYMLMWGPYFILSNRMSPEELGQISLYMRLATLVFVANVVINSVMLPRFAVSIKRKEYDDALSIYINCTLLSLCLAVVLILLVFLASPALLNSFFPEYGDNQGVFVALLCVFSLALSFGMSDQGLIMLGEEKAACYVLILFLIIELSFSFMYPGGLYVLPISVLLGFCGYKGMCSLLLYLSVRRRACE